MLTVIIELPPTKPILGKFGASTYSKAPDIFNTCPEVGFVMVTSTIPAACAGVLRLILLLSALVTPTAATPPKRTPGTPSSPIFSPINVTAVPPAVGPKPGLT